MLKKPIPPEVVFESLIFNYCPSGPVLIIGYALVKGGVVMVDAYTNFNY